MTIACASATTCLYARADHRLVVARKANEALAEADATFDGFLAVAREFAAAHRDLELAEEEPAEPKDPPAAVAEIASLDLRRENITSIIWATGYEYDYGWLRVPVLDAQGRPLQQRGVSPMPGLYFLGLHWMHTIKSGLLSGVGNDAQHLAEQIDLTTGWAHGASQNGA